MSINRLEAKIVFPLHFFSQDYSKFHYNVFVECKRNQPPPYHNSVVVFSIESDRFTLKLTMVKYSTPVERFDMVDFDLSNFSFPRHQDF